MSVNCAGRSAHKGIVRKLCGIEKNKQETDEMENKLLLIVNKLENHEQKHSENNTLLYVILIIIIVLIVAYVIMKVMKMYNKYKKAVQPK